MKSSVLEYYLLRIIKGGPCDLVEGIPEALALGYILGHWGMFGGYLFREKN